MSMKWPAGWETSDEGLWSWRGRRDSVSKLQQAHRNNEDGQCNETTYLKYTECHSRGVDSVCEQQYSKKNSRGDTDESNTLLDLPIMIPERADGSSKSKETEDTTEVKSNDCQISI